jgi:hypothetical protein
VELILLFIFQRHSFLMFDNHQNKNDVRTAYFHARRASCKRVE